VTAVKTSNLVYSRVVRDTAAPVDLLARASGGHGGHAADIPVVQKTYQSTPHSDLVKQAV
jgi:hypothetical protein